MNPRDYQVYQKAIKSLDPTGQLIRLNLENHEIRYSDSIIQHRKISQLTDEEIVRAYLVVKLITLLKYPPNCIELEKEHTIGRRNKKTSARIDVLVQKEGGVLTPFMIVEVKAPQSYDREMEEIKTQLFQVAGLEKGVQYLIYYTSYVSDSEIKERIVSISHSVFDSYTKWEKEGKPNLMGIPKEYGLIKKPVFTKGGVPNLRKDVTRDELERIRKDLHNVLWGGGRYQGNEIFNFVMKLFLAKIYDEKETSKAYDFQILSENGGTESPEKTYKRVNELYKKALKRYLSVPDDQISDRDVRKIGDKTIDVKKVKYVVESFQDVSLTENVYDILGDFFERFLWSEFKQSKGQFFTHLNLVRFILQVLEVDKLVVNRINEDSALPYFIDPACGSGTFLIETMKTVTDYVLTNQSQLENKASIQELLASNFPRYKKHAWAEKNIFGIEVNDDLAMATKINMVMHGDGSGNIECHNALASFEEFGIPMLKNSMMSSTYPKPVNERFDVVVSNPPFSIKLEKGDKEELPAHYLYASKSESENLFIERWYQFLKPNGRLGVVLPESVFDTKENRFIRLFLYRYFNIKAIVSLPALAFEPYTQTKTSLLFAQKKRMEEVQEYDQLWKNYADSYSRLKKQMENALEGDGVGNGKAFDREKEEFISLLRKYIQNDYDEKDSGLTLKELKNKYKAYIKEVDEDWWVFSQVSKEVDYDIAMIEVEEIGYKRTLRSERLRPNQLFKEETVGNRKLFMIDTENPIAALDYLKTKVKWN
jgi:type I restriction enzyme M protein